MIRFLILGALGACLVGCMGDNANNTGSIVKGSGSPTSRTHIGTGDGNKPTGGAQAHVGTPSGEHNADDGHGH